MNMDLKRDWQFFRDQNIGASYALDLARAERWAAEQDVVATWEYDLTPWNCGGVEWPSEVLCCLLSLDGHSASLCGIGDPSPDYRRVVEAELAVELQQTILDTIAMDTPSL